MSDDTTGKISPGKPYQVSLIVENTNQEGLTKIELVIAEQKITRWMWLKSGDKKEILFKGLTAPDAGTYQVRCGNILQNIQVKP
jgi:hypothetical protein